MSMASPARVALGLGANLGDREAALRRAIAALRVEPGTTVVAVSDFVETVPVGGPDQPAYLNAVVIIDVGVEPLELLAALQRIESDAGRDRNREVRWGPRRLDLDILAFGDAVIDEPELTVPHPRVLEREFVLLPWSQVAPDWVIAGTGLTVARALRSLRARRNTLAR